MPRNIAQETLEERYWALDDVKRRSLGLPKEPVACRQCYTLFDVKGCVCGDSDWAVVSVVIAELGLRLDALHSEERAAALSLPKSTTVLDNA